VWGTASDDDDNIVWGTDCEGADCDNVVWGTSAECDPNVDECDNIVWGTADEEDNIVWGTDCGEEECDNIVWGTMDAGLDTIFADPVTGPARYKAATWRQPAPRTPTVVPTVVVPPAAKKPAKAVKETPTRRRGGR
jgi:hypothetical protein